MIFSRTAFVQRILPGLMASLADHFGLESFADDAAFVADKNSPAADNDRYFNTTLNRIRTFLDGAWHTLGG